MDSESTRENNLGGFLSLQDNLPDSLPCKLNNSSQVNLRLSAEIFDSDRCIVFPGFVTQRDTWTSFAVSKWIDLITGRRFNHVRGGLEMDTGVRCVEMCV